MVAGLNVIPKRSFLTEYSCRIVPSRYPRLMRHWFDAMSGLGLEHGSLDPLSHDPVSWRGRAGQSTTFQAEPQPKGMLAFWPKTAIKRFLCYANLDTRPAGGEVHHAAASGPQAARRPAARPLSAWRRITLDGVSRIYNTPRISTSR